MDALETLATIAECLGLFAIAIGVGFLIATGIQIAKWWRHNAHRLDPAADAEIVEVTRDVLERLVEQAGEEGVPILASTGGIVGRLVSRETPEGLAIAMVWSCGVDGCAGHDTPEAATLCGEMRGFGGDLARWAKAADHEAGAEA